MLGLVFADQLPFPLVDGLARLGCTRLGSPGIFGVPTPKRCALPGETLVGDERRRPGYRASLRAHQSGPERAMRAPARGLSGNGVRLMPTQPQPTSAERESPLVAVAEMALRA